MTFPAPKKPKKVQTVRLGIDRCMLCGKTRRQAGGLHKAHILAKSKGGKTTVLLCLKHHSEYDEGRMSKSQLAKLGISRTQYGRYRPTTGSKRKQPKLTRRIQIEQTSTPDLIAKGTGAPYQSSPSAEEKLLIEASEKARKEILNNWLRKMHDILPKVRDLVDAGKAQTQILFLERFRNVLAEIPYPTVAPWNDEMREMVSQVNDFADSLLPPKRFGYEERCLDWMAVLLRTNDPPTRTLLKVRFLRIITVLMSDTRFESNPNPLYLFQELNDYETVPMMTLVKAALDEGRLAIGDGWSDERFKKMHLHIRFGDMSLRNPEGYRKLVDFLYEQMKAFDGSTNLVAYEKAKILWERASQGL